MIPTSLNVSSVGGCANIHRIRVKQEPVILASLGHFTPKPSALVYHCLHFAVISTGLCGGRKKPSTAL